MSLKIGLIFCNVFLLWTSSVSAEIFSVDGDWQVEITRCDNNGGWHQTIRRNVENQLKLTVPFNALNENTTVRVEGRIEVATPSKDTTTLLELKLDSYVEGAFYKSYKGNVTSEVFDINSTQTGYVGIALKFDRFTGAIELMNSAYAGSWNAVGCSRAKSFLTKLEVDV